MTRDLKGMFKGLKELLGDRFRVDLASRYCYATDASIYRAMPDAVAAPINTAEVAEIVKLANKHKVPLIPRGAGTGLCGGAVAVHGGIIVDTQRMHKIKEIHPESLYCVVEPGVIYDELNVALKPFGYVFPTAPGSGEACVIGGMVALNASGMRAIKYGATRDYVLGLEVVLPTGEVLKCGTRTLKNSSGYQLEKLFVGSEGTLGIITEVTLKIVQLPKSKAAILATFDSVEKAGQTVTKIIGKPVIPSSMELMDRTSIEAANKGADADFPDVAALLIIECDGPIEEVRREIEKVVQVCKASGALEVTPTEDLKLQEKWASGRQSVLPALGRLRPELKIVPLADDMAIPISNIGRTVLAFEEIAKRNKIIIATYGHASDGNLHTKLLIDPEKADDWKRAEKAVEEIYDAVLALDGSVSGEHGIGISKAPYFKKERATALATMKAIKTVLDPNNIMNPGKMFDWEKKGIMAPLRYHTEVD
jgi:glycolate oxidase